MSEGGAVTMPLQDQFWGAHFGMVKDQFGVHWMFDYEYPKA
jgi:PhnB protein